MTLEEFNRLPEAQARDRLALCCVSERWIEGMLAGRPYPSSSALLETGNTVWERLGREDILQAFAGHPKIGDIGSLREKYAGSGHLAASEQSGVQGADNRVIERLADGNRRYEDRFGYIFIVCATGKTAEEMCELLEHRLDNSPREELAIAAEEQRKILQLRLEKLL